MTEISRLTFTVSHETWYWANANFDKSKFAEVGVHREALTDAGEHDGVHWEFSISWYRFSDSTVGVKVGVFDDAWVAFHEIPEVFGRLATMAGSATPEAVVEMLTSSGFTDMTDRSDGPLVATR